ncbi:hypothetical protein DICPUDRAFT_82105 [Dictyostelium purpureum]|uniref:Uncharacterized protein n=1 Tax=Dictyostelium purpureum TaxID=5786 RepID=F0ZVI9_DICPU|nr:uncharacterized protein DICPUDRAFT_82105 [Dictyostelium purpureum]EGC32050.1 hypothetical protein DICPUDRAFT_82105 [Dictyostelium purpureum]|eukprot:XP_003291436.1 hypothetical protein DICPUDRAFT_82105 [Dictyostelium purpureum]
MKFFINVIIILIVCAASFINCQEAPIVKAYRPTAEGVEGQAVEGWTIFGYNFDLKQLNTEFKIGTYQYASTFNTVRNQSAILFNNLFDYKPPVFKIGESFTITANIAYKDIVSQPISCKYQEASYLNTKKDVTVAFDKKGGKTKIAGSFADLDISKYQVLLKDIEFKVTAIDKNSITVQYPEFKGEFFGFDLTLFIIHKEVCIYDQTENIMIEEYLDPISAEEPPRSEEDSSKGSNPGSTHAPTSSGENVDEPSDAFKSFSIPSIVIVTICLIQLFF